MFLRGKPLWVQLLCGVGIFALSSSIMYLICLIQPPLSPSNFTQSEEVALPFVWSALVGTTVAVGIVGTHVEVKLSAKMRLRAILVGYLLTAMLLAALEVMAFRYPDIHFPGGVTGYKILAMLTGLGFFGYLTECVVRDIMRVNPQESSQADKAVAVLGRKVHLKGSGPRRPAIHHRRDNYKVVAYGGKLPNNNQRLRRR